MIGDKICKLWKKEKKEHNMNAKQIRKEYFSEDEFDAKGILKGYQTGSSKCVEGWDLACQAFQKGDWDGVCFMVFLYI